MNKKFVVHITRAMDLAQIEKWKKIVFESGEYPKKMKNTDIIMVAINGMIEQETRKIGLRKKKEKANDN